MAPVTMTGEGVAEVEEEGLGRIAWSPTHAFKVAKAAPWSGLVGSLNAINIATAFWTSERGGVYSVCWFILLWTKKSQRVAGPFNEKEMDFLYYL